MMLKTADPADWFTDQAIVQLVKIGRDGLRGLDRQAFLKRAGEEPSALMSSVDKADELFHPGEVPVHAAGVGATERFGFNRNGDGFTKKTCDARHHTFVKHAKWFHHHDHHPNSPSYGRIVASSYSPVSGRVDLLGALYGTKEAAERYKGHVATEELEDLAAKKDIAVSMGAKVPMDKCSYCGNEAPSRKQYCTEETCEAGGCTEHLGKVVKVGGDLHHLGVDNPGDITWFDLSKVGRPAAPYAYAQRADWTKTAVDLFAYAAGARALLDAGATKTASVDAAEGARDAAWMLAKCLAKLAEEDDATPLTLPTGPQTASDLLWLGLNDPRPYVVKAACRALVDEWAVLPLGDFARATGRAKLAHEARALRWRDLPSRLLVDRLDDNPYLPSGLTTTQQKYAAELAARNQTVDPALYAVRLATRFPVKTAAASALSIAEPREAKALAVDYLAYKTAALLSLAEVAGAAFPAACRIAAALGRF